jgi:ABC-type transporter Mla subunit MlaD
MAQNVTFGAGNPFATAARWIKVWVGIVIIAFLIVCFFLMAIIAALKAIDRSLAVTDPAVTDIRGATDPLTGHIEKINGTLESIDTNLKPIPGQADTIIGSLTSIDAHVANVNGSLANTSSVLITALGGLKTEDDILEQADELGSDGKGVKRIIAQANTVNPILVEEVGADLDAVAVRHLSRVNGAAKHVQNICVNAKALGILGAGNCSR